MLGKILYSPAKLNKMFQAQFNVKDRVAVEVQFGKYFSVQYDLHVKHTFFYERGDIDVSVPVVLIGIEPSAVI